MHRPRFHLMPPSGWMNDPNGLTQWNGTYHQFFQYNPHEAQWGSIHWGHASSPDLVHWTMEPIALAPGEPGDPDEKGCWSGVLVDDGGVPTIVYSGDGEGHFQSCCLAVGSPDLREWTKVAENPVLTAPTGLDLLEFRDHSVWREGDGWRQVIGAGISGVGGTALLFESPDLRSWEFLGPVLIGDASGAELGGVPGELDWTGTVWECCDLFHLGEHGTGAPGAGVPGPNGDVDVLAFSAWATDTLHPLFYVGSFAGNRFEPRALYRMDFGERAFYAPQSFRDDAGRRVIFGWLQEERSKEEQLAAGWSGVMSLPRIMHVSDGQPWFELAPEVATLRGASGAAATPAAPVPLAPGQSLAGPSADQLDVEFEALLPTGSEITLVLCASPDDAEHTTFTFRCNGNGHGDVLLDRSASTANPTVTTVGRYGAFPCDGTIRVRAIVDHSVLEVFVNGWPLSARVYPTRPDATGVRLEARQTNAADPVQVTSFQWWHMNDAVPN